MSVHRHRWGIALLMSIGVCICYVDRTNLAYTIGAMASELHLSPIAKGLALSAFSFGYVALMPIAGMVADRVGPVRAVGWAAFVWSVATATTMAVVSPLSLICVRVAVGVGEAPVFPANARIVTERFPPNERTMATAIFDAGSYVGLAVSAPLVVYVTLQFGWRASFGLSALLGFGWVLVWRRYSGTDLPREPNPPLRSAGRHFAQLIVDRRVLGAGLGFFCYNYAKSFFLTWMPTFLADEQHLSAESIGYLAMAPPVVAIAAALGSAAVTDSLLKRGLAPTFARKAPLCAGLGLGCAVGLVPLIHGPLSIVALSVAFAATVSASPGIWSIPADIAPSPELVGTVGGIQNTLANVGSLVAPIATGWIVQETSSFASALYLTGGLCLVGAAIYATVVSPLTPIVLRDEGGQSV